MGEHTRRGLLVAAGAGALALGPGAAVAGALDRQKGSDEPGALTALIRAELDASLAYREAGMSRLADHEEQHAKALATLLESLGRPVPAAPTARSGLDPGAGVQAAIALETALLEGCARQLAKLGDPNMIRTVASVMASHAQHLALHRRARG